MNVTTNANAVTTGTRPLFGITNPVAELRPPEGPVPQKERSWMTKVDAKASEKIELSKGTIFVISIVPVFMALTLSYGGSIMGWTRSDQEIRTKVEVMSQQLKEVNQKIDKLADAQYIQALKQADADGVKRGTQAESDRRK